MKYLVISTNKKDVSTFVPDEVKRVNELRAAGIITNVWLNSDFSGAILVLEGADKGEVTAALDSLPIVINGAATYMLTEIIDLDSVAPDVA
jgi:hypothetical protein